MKKALVLLLILATLAPMVLSQPASAAVEKKPFYALSWSSFDQTKYPHLNGLVTTEFSNYGENAILSCGDAKMQYGSYTDADVTKMAEKLKASLSSRLAGMRYWHMKGPSTVLRLAPDDVVYLDFGVNQLKEMFTDLYKKMAEIKCPLDGVVIDTEIYAMDAWYLWDESNYSYDWYYNKNKMLYAQIVKNPKYKKLIRPLLEEYGFPFWPADPKNPHESEIFTICPEKKSKDPARYNRAYSIWNTVMRVHLNNYLNEWCYEPLKKYYPDATCSDYQSLDSKSWYKLASVTDDGTGIALSGGNSIRVGTNSTYSYYHDRPSGKFYYVDHDQYASYNDAVFEQSPFNSFMSEVNFTRHMYASTDSKKISPWLCSYLYTRDEKCTWGNSAYYTEQVYHLGMFAPDPFLFYNTLKEMGGEEGKARTAQTLNAILAALTDIAGYADRKPIELPQYWNAEYMVSGMYCGGRNLWRITPNTDEVSLKAFKVKDSDPTFSVKGQTITFPGGKILKDASIPNVGSCGYWVETKAGVNPVMTADADRYAKYPSYLENFDSYANGALNIDKMKESYAWKLSGGSASISNKALALSGDTTLRNVDIPNKITAGDSYAEDQVWEITFTIPSGLSANAEIQLLRYEGKGGATDGGIQIKGGKVYCSELVNNKQEARELAAVNPGTYTLKRVMNFNDPDNFTYDIYLLDSKGKEITNTKRVAASFFSSITSINFSTKNANKAVLLDNYKLYPSGITTDFELYDAGSGRNLLGNELEQARNKSTAYRLSWLNGTKTTKTVTVVAAIYENNALKAEKTVKTLTMKPGHDGVETGIVEVKAGHSVHVYLKNGNHQDVTYTEPGATESGSKPEPTKDNSTEATTSATKASTSVTKASKVTKATKVPTRATKATKATKATTPVQTLAPIETLATEPTAPIVKTEVFEGGIQELLDVLIQAGLDSVDKVKAALAQNLLTVNKDIPAENIVHYDVKADKDDIPDDGKMTIVLPYPAGTDARYTFYVAHMFTTDAHGKKPGDIEMPEVTNTEDGIQFEVTGLSPITVGWTAPDPEATEAPTESTDVPIDDTKEKDNTVLIIVIAAVAVLAIAGGLTFFLLKKKKPAAPAEATAEDPEEIEELSNDPEA